MTAIDETTVVLPGSGADLFLDSEEVAQMFSIIDRPDGTPVLDPGIEADFPVDVMAPRVPVARLLGQDDTARNVATTVVLVGLGLAALAITFVVLAGPVSAEQLRRR